MSRRRRTTRRTTGWDARAEKWWKWLLRLSALAAFGYVVFGPLKGTVPLGFYVLIGGVWGLPNVINWQQALSQGGDEEGDEE